MYQVQDQVVVKQSTGRSGPPTSEVKVGTVLAFGEDGDVIVSFPLPGGRTVKKVVSPQNCSPVNEIYKRTSVLVNPAFRQIYKGSV